MATFRIEILEMLGHESSMRGGYRWRVSDGGGQTLETGLAGSRAEALLEASDSVERLEWSGGRETF